MRRTKNGDALFNKTKYQLKLLSKQYLVDSYVVLTRRTVRTQKVDLGTYKTRLATKLIAKYSKCKQLQVAQSSNKKPRVQFIFNALIVAEMN